MSDYTAAKQYPGVATIFIARMLESCLLLRYLDKDKSIVPSPEFIECHRELLQEFGVNPPDIR